MTYRELLVELASDAADREDGELDMPVIVTDGDGDTHVGDVKSFAVDAGSTDDDALVLDGDQDDDTGGAA